MSELKEIVREKIREVAFKKVDDSQELIKSGVLTSILVVDLATALEDELNITIPFTEITAENFSSLNQISDYIKTKQ